MLFHLYCHILQIFSSVAFPTKVKNRCPVKNSIQCAIQGIMVVKVIFPVSRLAVAGEDHTGISGFVIASVNEIEEQPRIGLIESAVPNLIYDQAGRLDQSFHGFIQLPIHPGTVKAVSELRHFDEI